MNAGFRSIFLPILLTACLVGAGGSMACGPEFETAVFTGNRNPDAPLEEYLQGRLGIVQPAYARSYLVAAYRHLSGKGLSSDERKAMLEVLNERISTYYYLGEFQSDSDANPTLREWMDVRSMVGDGARAPVPAKESGFQSFDNCLRDSFENAAATLQDRIERFGASSRDVAEWVQAQDQVFANCSDREAHIPPEVPEGVDPLIARDRVYQTASALFYAGDYDKSAALFAGIAGDPDSPWNQIAPYLEGRALLRKALSAADREPAGKDSRQQAESGVREMFERARDQFLKVLERPDLAQWHSSSRKMVNLIRFRLSPDERRKELARALLEDSPGEVYKQDLIDYIWLMDRYSEASSDDGAPKGEGAAGVKQDATSPKGLEAEGDLTDWICTFQSDGRKLLDHALERYRATGTLPWLLAAISKVGPEDPGAPAILEAARKVPKDSPGILGIRYHLARCLLLSGKADEARTVADELLSIPEEEMPLSSRNQLLALRMRLARDLDEFLLFARRVPVRFSFSSDYPYSKIDLTVGADDSGEKERLRKLMQGAPLLDVDAALALNGAFPLQLLAKAVRSESLPDHLRLPLARAAWVRAVLLDRDDIAVELAGWLKDREPSLRSHLSGYLNAKSPEARKSAAVLTVLRLPGLRPCLDTGLGRLTALDRIDNYRDNWWCSFNCKDSSAEDFQYMRYNYCEGGDVLPAYLRVLYAGGKIGFPVFLGADEKEAARKEQAALAALGSGPNYLCSFAMAWAKKEANHPAVPEALHLAVRATRYGCTDGGTTKLSKGVFELLHKKYPQSPWKKKTPYWY